MLKQAIKERPFPLVADMVVAVMADLKTRYRRPVRPQYACRTVSYGCVSGQGFGFLFTGHDDRVVKCPHGKVGDRLWVRERARVIETSDGMSYAGNVADDGPEHRRVRIKYEADGFETDWLPYPARLEYVEVGRCIPNGCYREASRIKLEITEVRVERLQAITEEEAIAEGFRSRVSPCFESLGKLPPERDSPRDVFSQVWQAIYGNKPTHWYANPWVWVIGFRRLQAA